MTDNLLDIDVRLLVLRYGRPKVLAALSRLVEQTPAEFEQQLQALARKPSAGRKKAPNLALVEVAALECRDRSEVLEPLRVLALAFENRSFLPNLRDVQRFLDRAGAPAQKFKSRAIAGPVVIRTLSKLPKDELVSLASRDASGGESDYSLLSRAIMGAASDDRGSRG
ncbi:MAG: hypothetical protein J0I21_11735 [Alphaproteobacteria bacterium]|nr:hypothetical protein [Alphaproteobacteria bacterium]